MSEENNRVSVPDEENFEENGSGIFSEDLRLETAEKDQEETGEQAEYTAEEEAEPPVKTVYAASVGASAVAANASFLKRFFKATRTVDAPLYYVRETVSWILVLVVAFVVAILINMYVIRMSNVVGDSMQQTYLNGDRVFLSKLPYVFGEPERGDVIVFDHTKEVKNFSQNFRESVRFNLLTQMFMKDKQLADLQHKYYIKRVIGVEGDVISVREGELYLNGEKIGDEPYTNHEDPMGPPNYSKWEGKEWTVGKGELFVMGDNRNHSTDSREIGIIPLGCVLGKVLK